MFGSIIDISLVTLFAIVWGTVCGVVISLFFIASRDKKTFILIASKLGNRLISKAVKSTLIINMITPLIAASLPIFTHVRKWLDGSSTVVDISCATIKEEVMHIPFMYRRREWVLLVKCNRSKENNETKWIVDGIDVKHCPMLAFTVTKEDMNATTLHVVEDEEVVI